MKNDIILAGVGGQGILSIAAVISMAALKSNLFFKQSEVHGMSQRGGAVQSHLRISDTKIFSDLVPEGKADIVLAVEPMESLRYLPMLSDKGWIVTNTQPFINIPNYPELESVLNEISKYPRAIAINADEIAQKLNSPLSSNIVMVGAVSSLLQVAYDQLEEGIRFIFGKKGDSVVQANLNALAAGREHAHH